jgi:hypothetical protein
VNVSDAALDALRQNHPVLVQATIDAASRVLRHEFDLLGSGPFTPDDPDRPADAAGYRPIDWYLDPVSGQRFPRGIALLSWNFEQMRPARADIKLPWELARCQHWPLLGQAFRLTGDDRFAIEIERELRDFMEANPIGSAVNWACTMDVALRAANWAIGLDLVRGCSVLTADFWADAHRALFDTGRSSRRPREQLRDNSNHFPSNVVGLFFSRRSSTICRWPHNASAARPAGNGVQVPPTGADFESSVLPPPDDRVVPRRRTTGGLQRRAAPARHAFAPA